MAGEMRYIGVGEESTFGTPVEATDWMDFSRAEVDVPSNPIVVFEGAAGRSRKVIAPGAYIPGGSLELPVDPSRFPWFLKWFFGDVSTLGSNPTTSTTLSSPANAGDTTLYLSSTAGISVGDFLQVGTNWENQEIVRVTGVGAGSVTVEKPILHSYASGEQVQEVTAPFTHHFKLRRDKIVIPNSFTLRIGRDVFEHVFQGSVIDTLELTLEKDFLMGRLEVRAQKDFKNTLNTNAKSFPSTFFEARTGFFGIAGADNLSRLYSITVRMQNSIPAEAAIRHGSRFPRDFEYGSFTLEGRLRLIYRNTDEYQRYWGDIAGPSGSVINTFAIERWLDAGGGNELWILVPRAYWTEVRAPLVGRDRIIQEVSFSGLDDPGQMDQPILIKVKNQVYRY